MKEIKSINADHIQRIILSNPEFIKVLAYNYGEHRDNIIFKMKDGARLKGLKGKYYYLREEYKNKLVSDHILYSIYKPEIKTITAKGEWTIYKDE